jgi:hypothetical protein
VDINGRMLSIVFLAALPGVFGLMAPWMSRAERVEGDFAPGVSRPRLCAANPPFPRKSLPRVSTPPEFAESESEETGEDEESPLAMSFGELLLGFGASPARGMGGSPGCPAHRAAWRLFLLYQHLVC